MADYIIINGMIINGKNEAPFPGNVVIEDGIIREITGTTVIPENASGAEILDARGGYVTPGFIDIHRHGDWEALRNGDDELLNRQGITSVVNGNCGLSVAPTGRKYGSEILSFLSSVTGEVPERYLETDQDGNLICPPAESFQGYMDALKKTKRSVNTGMLAGNGTIRAAAAGYAPGRLTREEVRSVWKNLEDSLSAGALGVSLGVAYAPEFEYDVPGITEALMPLKGTDIPITTHVRSEGDGFVESLQEVIQVAKTLRIPLHVSHVKCIGKKNWGVRCREVLDLFRRSREEGVQLDFDLYPYLTGSTQLVHLLPPEAQEGGTDEIVERLHDSVYRWHLTQILRKPSRHFENIVELAGFDQIYASTLHSAEYAQMAGMSLAEIAQLCGKDPYDVLYDILIAEQCQATMLDTIAAEEDMLKFLKDPYSNLISDATYPSGGKYHPRVYAAFPKVLTEYVRDRHIFSVQEAVYKMTGRPAGALGLDRGVLEKGKPADLTVFHLENLQAPADFENPSRFCTGFDYVLTGGEIVVKNDQWKNAGTGSILKK